MSGCCKQGNRMKISLNILLISFLILIFSCQVKIPSNTKGFKKVTVAFSGFGCESECPYEALSVDSSLTIKYYGGEFANKNGYFIGKVSQKTWDSIETKFDKFVLSGIDSLQYENSDQPMVEFYITNKVKKHSFKYNTGKMVTQDVQILKWFMQLSNHAITLNKSDSLTFETTIQSPLFIPLF